MAQAVEGLPVPVRLASADEPALQVKRGRSPAAAPGIAAFTAPFSGLGPVRPILVGGDRIALERFLLEPVERWIRLAGVGRSGDGGRRHSVR